MISGSEGRMVHELQQLHHQEKRMKLEFNEPSYYANVVDVTEFSHAPMQKQRLLPRALDSLLTANEVILHNLAWLYSTLQNIFASPHALQNFSLIID